MNTFTKKILTFCAAIVLLGTQACGILDQPSPNDIDVEKAYNTAQDAENGLIGVYNSMQTRSYYGGNYLLLSEAMTDNAGTGGYDNSALDEFATKNITTSNIYAEQMWVACYYTIANANFLLAGLAKIQDANLTPERKKAIEGQARSLRALAHFDLLRYYGEHWDMNSKKGVPIINKVQKITDAPARNTVAETYAFVTSELLAAKGLVNADDRSKNFVNVRTIDALLARVYLYQKNNAEAVNFANLVINDAEYALLSSSDFTSIYTNYNTSEEIFSLSFDSQNRSGYNGLTYSRADALRSEILFLPSENLKLFFDARPNDPRATLLDYTNNDETISPDGRTQKYRGEEKEDNPAYIIRLAEVYFIRAEAAGKVGGLADINAVRTARSLPAIAAADVATDGDYITAILNERRAELNMEGHRYFDLARTQQYANIIQTDAYRAILPIPLREITASNGAIEQNTGY